MPKKTFVGELREESIKKLVEMRKKLRRELFSLRMKNRLRSLKEVDTIGKTRKKIAQINAVLSSKTKEANGSDRK